MEFTEQEKKMLATIRRLCREKKVKNLELAAYLGVTGNVVTEWFGGRCRSFVKYAHAIAAFFSLPVEALWDAESPIGTAPAAPPSRPDKKTEEELKVALFGGDGEVTDEMWEEVRSFAAFLKEKHRQKN